MLFMTCRSWFIFLFFRAFTWSTTPSSFLQPTPQASSSWVWWATTSSAQPTTRKTFSVAQRVTAKSGVRSPPSWSAPTDRPTVAFTRANWWPQGFGEWLATWTTRATWWAHWRIAWPVVEITYCPIFTSSTWPSYWCTAAFVMSTAVEASTARTGSATPLLCPTVYCRTSSSAYPRSLQPRTGKHFALLFSVALCAYFLTASSFIGVCVEGFTKIILPFSEWVSASVWIYQYKIIKVTLHYRMTLKKRYCYQTQVLIRLNNNCFSEDSLYREYSSLLFWM